MRSSDAPSDPWYRDADPEQGPGILLDPANFPPSPQDDGPRDAFARRQDSIAHLNSALARRTAREIHNAVVDKRLDWMRNSLDLANNRGWLPRAESFRD
jgi:hypothetical protein